MLLDPLRALFQEIWEKEVFPTDWSTSLLLPIFKKGDKSVCENYRGISLIDVAAKVFAVVLLNRFSTVRDTRTRPNQGGFRRGRGCVDQIFTLRRTLEHRYKFQQPTTACFIDFRAAFDSVDRASLWKIVEADGMPAKMVNLIKSYYSATRARVRVYGEESATFPLTTGVRQGCPLSPVLFNFAVDWTLRQALDDYQGVQLSQDFWIADLEYADDIVVLGRDPDDLQPILDKINRYANTIGLQINANKTKYFTTSCNPSTRLSIAGELLEQVTSFRYLGSTMLPNGQAKEEIKLRVDKARLAFLQLRRNLWLRGEISLRTKIRVFRAAIRPVLLYGCETWPTRVEDIRKLEAFDHWCLRRISKTGWNERVSNEEIRLKCFGIPRISTVVQQQRLRWFGHVLRRSDDTLIRCSLSPPPCSGWRCRAGGQLKTWISSVKTDVDRLGLCAVYGVRRWCRNWVSICAELAVDRVAWAASVRDISEADSSSRRR